MSGNGDEADGVIRTNYGINSVVLNEQMEVDIANNSNGGGDGANNVNGGMSSSAIQQRIALPPGFSGSLGMARGSGPRANPSPRLAAPPPPPPPKKSKLFFKDCGGLEKQINFLKSAVLMPIQNQNASQNQFQRFNLQPPKGILFYGTPGTGKTRLAQALGNELTRSLGRNVHFIYRKGQDIASMYFGQSSTNLRRVFQEATAMQPCILFFDELDGLCPSRDTPMISQANVTIVTTMLGLMDALPVGKVFVIGATNRLEAVDPALRRPGRFDKYLEFLPPTIQGRFDILSIHTRKWKHQPPKVVLEQMSGRTTGFSGADLFKLCLDSFDSALTRLIGGKKDFQNVNFGNLNVTMEDWEVALGKMSPSNSAVFGSTFYTPPLSLGDHLDPLIRGDVEEITERVVKFFPDNKEAPRFGEDAIIQSVYVWTETGTSLATIDDLIIAQVLRCQQLGKYPIYCISPEILYSSNWQEWARKFDSTVSQAIAAGSAILYAQNVDALWKIIKDNHVGATMDLKQQLERLRGTSVLLLATGSTSPLSFLSDNPFKEPLSRSTDVNYEVDYPTDDERLQFFEPLFGTLVLKDNVNWTNENAAKLVDRLDTAMENTFQQHIGSIMLLYDVLVQGLHNIAGVNDSKAILDKIDEIMGSYINMRL